MTADPWALLREARDEVKVGAFTVAANVLVERIEAAIAEYESDMAEHRRRFGMEVKDLDRHLAAARAWKGDK
jgi:hypothetical protein